MHIQVLHQDGTIERLTLCEGDWTVGDGAVQHRISHNALDYFFTPDGYYDGWGGVVCGVTEAEARDITEAMEEKREYVKDA
jgi:hypothetical protein